jgi:hypothetical protein
METTNFHSICDGCNMYIEGGCVGYYLPIIEDMVCPCSICLVKMVCRDICEGLHDHRKLEGLYDESKKCL